MDGRIARERLSNDIIKAYSIELQEQMLVAQDWGTLLTAAPLALGFVGQCMNVAAAPEAQGIKLRRPQNGFRFLQLVDPALPSRAFH